MTNLLSLILAAIMPLCSTMAPIEPIEPIPQGTAYISQEPMYGEAEITALAKLIWGEARGISSDTEKAAVVWTALNRYDAGIDIDHDKMTVEEFVKLTEDAYGGGTIRKLREAYAEE